MQHRCPCETLSVLQPDGVALLLQWDLATVYEAHQIGKHRYHHCNT